MTNSGENCCVMPCPGKTLLAGWTCRHKKFGNSEMGWKALVFFLACSHPLVPTGCKKPKSCIVNPAVEEDVKPEGEGFRGLKGINFTSLKIWSKLLDSSLKRRLGELCAFSPVWLWDDNIFSQLGDLIISWLQPLNWKYTLLPELGSSGPNVGLWW